MAETLDAIVVGSGFGGSVSACRLAQAGAKVLVLERGRAWPPGSFPRTPGDLHDRGFWEPEEGATGLFDLQTFSGFTALGAAGLGGGSLIYANVLLRKDKDTFVRERLDDGGRENWPLDHAALEDGYRKAESMLGATPYPFAEQTPKADAFARAARSLGRGTVEHPPLAVSFSSSPTERRTVPSKARTLYEEHTRLTCNLCGRCDTGCNDGAKNTMDHTYLAVAAAKGATIRCGSEVTAIRPVREGWEVDYTYRPHLRDERLPHLFDDDVTRTRVTVRAKVLVLAAGVFGTARLLLGARAVMPDLSPRLGLGFSPNGDMLAFALKTRDALRPSYGPVITTTLRLRDDESGSGRELLLQDAGSPDWAEWMWHLQSLPGNALRFAVGRGLERINERLHGRVDTRLGGEARQLIGDARASAHMLPLLAMGRDVPDGRLHLRGGELDCTWSLEPSQAHFDEIDRVAGAVTRALGGEYLDGRGLRKMRTMTVHPLGGAGMGEDWSTGVVDPNGQVFNHPGLFVADGSVMPGPVGANPSLTIMALAEHFSTAMEAALGA